MAQKDKKSATKKVSSTTKVTRITATDTEETPAKKATAKIAPKLKETKAKQPKATSGTETRSKNPLKAIGGYFAGAWYELKQVRWPNRKATWSLTLAVIVFTAFFAVLILLLDALFKYLFQLILG